MVFKIESINTETVLKDDTTNLRVVVGIYDGESKLEERVFGFPSDSTRKQIDKELGKFKKLYLEESEAALRNADKDKQSKKTTKLINDLEGQEL